MSVLDRFSLSGKTAMVTGCSQGIGQAMAEGLAEAGADIVGVSLDYKNSDVEQRIAALGRSFSAYTCDFSDRAAVRAMIEQVTAEHGVPDILFNNAGTIRRAPAAEHGDADWDLVIEVNLNSQFVLTRELGRGMVERGSGKIVFTASLLSFQGGITVPGYAASKGGVAQLAKAFANEWAERGVNVNAIAPGYVATANTKALREDAVRSEQVLSRIPAGRWGEPEDFKGPAVFLSSAASDYVHGAVMLVDGGWMAR